MLPDHEIIAITGHVARHIGDPKDVLHELIPQDLHIDIHVVAPTPRRDYYTLVTSGMSERAMKAPREFRDRRYAELMICLPSDWPLGDEEETELYDWPLDWLRLLARAPHEFGLWFGPDHTVPNGDPPEPLGQGVDFCCMMLREPGTTSPDFAALKTGKKTIHFYGLVPIYQDEMELALSEGHDALAARLDAARVTELLNVHRPSVCGTEP